MGAIKNIIYILEIPRTCTLIHQKFFRVPLTLITFVGEIDIEALKDVLYQFEYFLQNRYISKSIDTCNVYVVDDYLQLLVL